MLYDDFLEMNGQTLSDEEWRDLEDEDHAQIAHMEDLIWELNDQLKENKETLDDISEIEQELPGDPFWVWTSQRVYYSDEEDYGDGPVVRNTIRHPGINPTWNYITYDEFEDAEYRQHMKEVVESLEDRLKGNHEIPQDIVGIELGKDNSKFRAYTKHRVYYAEKDEFNDIVVRGTFRRPAWAVAG